MLKAANMGLISVTVYEFSAALILNKHENMNGRMTRKYGSKIETQNFKFIEQLRQQPHAPTQSVSPHN